MKKKDISATVDVNTIVTAARLAVSGYNSDMQKKRNNFIYNSLYLIAGFLLVLPLLLAVVVKSDVVYSAILLFTIIPACILGVVGSSIKRNSNAGVLITVGVAFIVLIVSPILYFNTH